MSRGVNSVHLIGNLGRQPEIRYTGNGTAVCNFSVAVGERKKQDGEWVDHVEWVNIVAWGKTAENCAEYLDKGSQVWVDGRLQTRKWTDKVGQDRYSTEVVANNVQFLGGKPVDRSNPTTTGDSGFPGGDPNAEVPF